MTIERANASSGWVGYAVQTAGNGGSELLIFVLRAAHSHDLFAVIEIRSGWTRYGGAVDVERAADLYAQGWTLRQIAAELSLTETRSTISYAVLASPPKRRAGIQPGKAPRIADVHFPVGGPRFRPCLEDCPRDGA